MIDQAAWTAAAHARPGIAVYPEMLRQPTPPAVRAVQRPPTPTDVDLPPVTRWRWWHRWTRR